MQINDGISTALNSQYSPATCFVSLTFRMLYLILCRMIWYWKKFAFDCQLRNQEMKKLSQLPDPDSPWLCPRCEPRPLDWWNRCRRASVLSSLFFPRQCAPWCQCCGFSCREKGEGGMVEEWMAKWRRSSEIWLTLVWIRQCAGSGSVSFWASRILIWQSEVRIRILPSSSKNCKKKPSFLLFCDFLMTFYLWRMMQMHLQKVR